MRYEHLGESALILRDLPAEPWRIARALNGCLPHGCYEATASCETLGVYFDPLAPVDPEELVTLIESLECDRSPGTLRKVPVCFECGEDTEPVCGHLGIAPDRLAALMTAATFRCVAVGFRPGFPYLSGLPPDLCGVPRLQRPRVDVGAGAVAITGNQCGIYPQAGPGGWNIVGRTPWTLERHGPIAEAGDEIAFEAMPLSHYFRALEP